MFCVPDGSQGSDLYSYKLFTGDLVLQMGCEMLKGLTANMAGKIRSLEVQVEMGLTVDIRL